jgi:PAS domain S-box-containing protein
MTDPKDQSSDLSDLRRRAEEQLQAESVPGEELSPAAAARLIHELRVHQIELEMQNEELRLSQARLEESRSKYADLYDFAPVGYLTLNKRGLVVEANSTAATLLGVERLRLIGRLFPNFLVTKDRTVFRQILSNTLKLPERRGEFHLQDADGGVRTVLLNLRFPLGAEGRGGQCRLTLTDITELKQAQQDLEKSRQELRLLNQTLEQQVQERTSELEKSRVELRLLNQTLEQQVQERTSELAQATRELEYFSYTVAHDLKTPLRGIEGFSRMLLVEHTAGLDPEGRRLLQVVVDNTQLMRRLIDDLHNLARLACQQMRKVSLDLNSLAQGVFQRLKSLEPGRDLRLIVKESPPAWGDSSLLYQVLMNLLENAFKFTRENKTAVIEVGGRSKGMENIYYVKDNGVGFNEEDMHKMFVVFQRLHDGKAYEGTGVGLATVQRIIQRHGGRVWAEGKVGEGATFYFALPKARE